ncbi:MAG TPA: OmpA family protein [Stellaceae bacterium]|nr:OmpA family protein [Stellaceae bacterium]
MRARSIAVAVSATAVVAILSTGLWPSTGAASPVDGPYLRLEGGGFLPNASVANSTGGNINFKPSAGPIGGGAVGLRLAPIRLELDSDWLRAKISGSSPALSGHMTNIPIMANGFLDIVNGSRLEPYIGFGLGMTMLSVKANGATGALVNASTRAFAFQPIIGVNFALTDRLTAGLQYRYFKSVDAWLGANNGQRIEVSNGANILLATLTYHFFAPKPAPAAGAATAPPLATPQPALATAPPVAPPLARPAPHVYLVFFAFNSSKLDAAGRRAADEAVLAYKQDPTNDIEVRGYTDLVGSDAYNLALSKRRAMAVYDYFAAHGVKPADMGIDWEGKADPRVNTPKPEPQNRRVEISM